MDQNKNDNVVSFESISMHFGDLKANDSISLEINKGEIFALVGENGAGKTTLMKILYGLYTPTEGQVRIKGQLISNFSPRNSMDAGVGMVHQHFMLVPSFTVAQNIVLAHEPRKNLLFYDQKSSVKVVNDLVSRYGLKVDPNATIEDLSLGERQRVEILKALYMGAEILILDEPTAVLTPQETEELFAVIRSIVENESVTVIIITHKLYEVMAVSDRVAVMRAGRLIGVEETKNVSETQLASMMVGRDMLFEPLKRADIKGEVLLETENLNAHDTQNYPALKNVSFRIHSGEILGVAGIEGNGQSELAEVLTGMRRLTSGKIEIRGEDCTKLSPGEIRKKGLAHIPEDRIETGLAEDATIAENLLLGRSHEREFAKKGIHMMPNKIGEFAKNLMKRFDIRAGSSDASVKTLSGGNMQKVVVAREFSFETDLLIIAQPTRGVDIGASSGIHEFIIEKRNAGAAILLISADLDEIFRLSDRIITMYEGEINGEFSIDEFNKEAIGLCMAGGRKELSDGRN